MSEMELRRFHSFLEEVIDRSFIDGNLSVERVVNEILTKHPERLEAIRPHLDALGLRWLVRNNGRAKKRTGDLEPDMFGDYGLGKLVSISYVDGQGKRRWYRKRRGDLSFDDLDRIRALQDERPSRVSKQRSEMDAIAARTERYRAMTDNVADALAMAQRDGL